MIVFVLFLGIAEFQEAAMMCSLAADGTICLWNCATRWCVVRAQPLLIDSRGKSNPLFSLVEGINAGHVLVYFYITLVYAFSEGIISLDSFDSPEGKCLDILVGGSCGKNRVLEWKVSTYFVHMDLISYIVISRRNLFIYRLLCYACKSTATEA